jgi:Zn-dependent alcohol dehydrogenase
MPRAVDTGERKKELVMSLGAEKWVDFKESKNLVADIQAATGGPGPQVALIATGNVLSIEVHCRSQYLLTWAILGRTVLTSCSVP